MRLCRVLGSVTQTAKHESYLGHKLLVVEPVDDRGEPCAASFLAIDRVQAGAGDLVLVMTEGNGVRQLIVGEPPIRSLIIGVVDAVDSVPQASHG
ncbi:MAG: EutN/CcmL family microcompartment protein [Deltaproteobacteria bacterium]|nr:EutN/CcmL family microcompartment protein [Deltaproteobacteria bacterium]